MPAVPAVAGGRGAGGRGGGGRGRGAGASAVPAVPAVLAAPLPSSSDDEDVRLGISEWLHTPTTLRPCPRLGGWALQAAAGHQSCLRKRQCIRRCGESRERRAQQYVSTAATCRQRPPLPPRATAFIKVVHSRARQQSTSAYRSSRSEPQRTAKRATAQGNSIRQRRPYWRGEQPRPGTPVLRTVTRRRHSVPPLTNQNREGGSQKGLK